MTKSFSGEGIVLKRANFGEADRLITIFTKEHGKLSVLAKGVRKITSKKRGSLEPGSRCRLFIIKTKSIDLLTQTEIIHTLTSSKTDLIRMTQIFQLLEIVDALTAEGEAHPEVYLTLTETLTSLATQGNKRKILLSAIKNIVHDLGFGPPANLSDIELKYYIEDLGNRSLRSKRFLTVFSK